MASRKLRVAAGQPPPPNPRATGTIGATTRDGGSTQVTENGLPLDTFRWDQPGAAPTGNGVNAFGGVRTPATP